MSELKGGCACGSIRYAVKGDPQFSFHCQCRQCQRITGAGHSSQFMVEETSANIEGEIKYYEQSIDENSIKHSGFCPNCGSPILTKVSSNPDFLFFHAVTLDDPRQFHPKNVAHSSSAQSWDFVDPSLEVL